MFFIELNNELVRVAVGQTKCRQFEPHAGRIPFEMTRSFNNFVWHLPTQLQQLCMSMCTCDIVRLRSGRRSTNSMIKMFIYLDMTLTEYKTCQKRLIFLKKIT